MLLSSCLISSPTVQPTVSRLCAHYNYVRIKRAVFKTTDGFGLQGFQLLRSILDVEGQFSEARCLKVLPLALAAYQENLPSHYSSQYHENKVRG